MEACNIKMCPGHLKLVLREVELKSPGTGWDEWGEEERI